MRYKILKIWFVEAANEQEAAKWLASDPVASFQSIKPADEEYKPRGFFSALWRQLFG